MHINIHWLLVVNYGKAVVVDGGCATVQVLLQVFW